MPPKPDYFSLARAAMNQDDDFAFSEAIEAQKQVDPSGTRDMAELMILRMFHKVNPHNSAAMRMLEKSIETIAELTPILIYDETQRKLTLRALTVAEAASEYADDVAAREIREAQSLALHTSKVAAVGNAQRAGLLGSTGRPKSRLRLVPVH